MQNYLFTGIAVLVMWGPAPWSSLPLAHRELISIHDIELIHRERATGGARRWAFASFANLRARDAHRGGRKQYVRTIRLSGTVGASS